MPDQRVLDIWKRKLQPVRLHQKFKINVWDLYGTFLRCRKRMLPELCNLYCFLFFPYNIFTTWTDAFPKTATADHFGYFLHSLRYFASNNQIGVSLCHVLKILYHIQKTREGNAAVLWWLDFSYRIPWNPNALFNCSIGSRRLQIHFGNDKSKWVECLHHQQLKLHKLFYSATSTATLTSVLPASPGLLNIKSINQSYYSEINLP